MCRQVGVSRGRGKAVFSQLRNGRGCDRSQTRGIVDRGHGNADGGDIAVGDSVICLEGEAVLTVPVRIRRVGQVWRCASQGAVFGLLNNRKSQRIVINIRGDQGNHQRGIFISGYCLFLGYRSIIYWSDGDGDGGNFRISRAIVGFVGESVSAMVVGIGGIGERTILVQHQRAICGIGY